MGSLGNSYSPWVSKPAKTSMQQVEAVSRNSTRESSSSIRDLCRECTSAFENCTRHKSLMEHDWAKYSSAEFSVIVGSDSFALSLFRASFGLCLDSEPSNRFILIVPRVLTILRDDLIECIRCAEAQSSTDEATKKVDSSLKSMSQIMESITESNMQSCFPQSDGRSKPEEHEELRAFLGIMCLRQRTKNEFGVEARYEVSKLDALSTEECIKISQELKLSKAQQRLIEVNLRRRSRFLQAQERDRQESVGDPTKASTTQGNSGVQEAEEKVSQPVMTALTALRAAGRYPKAPKLPEGTMAFKCPCCCENLPAVFANDNKLWRDHLFEDISPYTCILPDCPTPFATYSTVPEWENHFEEKHRSCHICRLCEYNHITFPGLEALVAHIRTEHAEVASPRLVQTMAFWSEVKTIGTSQCPLCDKTGLAHSPEFVQHVLGCIHDFSLYSLPWDRLCQD